MYPLHELTNSIYAKTSYIDVEVTYASTQYVGFSSRNQALD
jgi:hypothetical protein